MIDTALVRAALLQFAEDEFDWPSYGSFINYFGDQRDKTYDVPGLGPVRIVDYHNYDSAKNYDSWTEQLWIVFEIQGVLYKAEGAHTSYTGSEWEDELKIVRPVEKTITVYEVA